MGTTASYDLFPDAPSERAMARARWLAREGRVADAEDAYRGVLATHPDLKACWAEYFELLRRSGRRDDALQLAGRALAQFGGSGAGRRTSGAARGGGAGDPGDSPLRLLRPAPAGPARSRRGVVRPDRRRGARARPRSGRAERRHAGGDPARGGRRPRLAGRAD